MAVRTPSIAKTTSGVTVTWTGLLNGDTGSPVEFCEAFHTAIVTGTFGTGGTAQVQGSNDNSNWAVLQDPSGANVQLTAAACKSIGGRTQLLRPAVTAGDGTTSLTVSMFFATYS